MNTDIIQAIKSLFHSGDKIDKLTSMATELEAKAEKAEAEAALHKRIDNANKRIQVAKPKNGSFHLGLGKVLIGLVVLVVVILYGFQSCH